MIVSKFFGYGARRIDINILTYVMTNSSSLIIIYQTIWTYLLCIYLLELNNSSFFTVRAYQYIIYLWIMNLMFPQIHYRPQNQGFSWSTQRPAIFQAGV